MSQIDARNFDGDPIDLRILAALQKDAWISQSAVARLTGLSTAAVSHRFARLRKSGAIRRVSAVLDAPRMGFDVAAFVEVVIEPARHEKAFLAAMAREPEILEVHHVTGDFSLLLKVRTRDRETLRRLLLDRIGARPGVRRTRTVIVLASPKEETALPLDPQHRKEKHP